MTTKGNNIYFASDFHLGMYPEEKSRQRELHIVNWLNDIQDDMKELWLLGDIFDYWFEYKKVIPKGFTRFLGKLAELSDKGVKIHFFSGNHDVWLFDYFPKEIGAEVHHNPIVIEMGSKTFFLSHGDGLLKKDKIYLILKSMFRSKFLQWCYARIHPNGSISFAHWWSKKSRSDKESVYAFKGDENEEQIRFAKMFYEENPDINYFLFGHRHLPYDVRISKSCRAICLGDWISNFSYGIFDGTEFKLEKY